jgi:hypothetical protein
MRRQWLNARVAETQGWIVRITDADDEPHFESGELVGLPPDWRARDMFLNHIFGEEQESEIGPDVEHWDWLPDYAGDPAAWGALIEKESVWPQPVLDVEGAVKGWHGHHLKMAFAGSVPGLWNRPGEAVCAAVLYAVHGIDPLPYIGD